MVIFPRQGSQLENSHSRPCCPHFVFSDSSATSPPPPPSPSTAVKQSSNCPECRTGCTCNQLAKVNSAIGHLPPLNIPPVPSSPASPAAKRRSYKCASCRPPAGHQIVTLANLHSDTLAHTILYCISLYCLNRPNYHVPPFLARWLLATSRG